jgi:DNA-binding GntR family transcriptional regulator
MFLLEICGKLAIERITENEINKLELLLNDLKKEKNRYEFIKLESKFHDLLNCSTKNHSLISTLEYLRNHLNRLLFFIKIRNGDSYFSRIPKDFEYIISSLREKNKEECIRILKEHAMEFVEYVKESIYNKS